MKCCENVKHCIGKVCKWLLIVGGLNWGLVGLFEFNLVEALFGQTMLSRLVYDVVGVAAVLKILQGFCGCSGSCSIKK